MSISVFTNKEKMPTNDDLIPALGSTYNLWMTIRDFTVQKYPSVLLEWNYPGKKYGWSYRIKDKKRTIIYLLPRDGFFKVAFVFGQKATEQVINSKISSNIINELQNAKVYAEGRGIRIDVTDESIIKDIKKLVEIKLAC